MTLHACTEPGFAVKSPVDNQLDLKTDLPVWLANFLENRLSDQASTKPYERYIFELLADRKLSIKDKLVGIVIWLHANRLSGEDAWPGQELIAWCLGCKPEAVRRSTRNLETFGYLSTEPGKNQRSSRYTLLVRNRQLMEIPKRTMDELIAIFHPLQPEEPTPSSERGSPPPARGGNLPFNLPHEPANYISINGDDYITGVMTSSSGMTTGRMKRKRKTRQGKASFDFMPAEITLQVVFESGDLNDTDDITDAEIVHTIKTATAGKVGSALLNDEGIFTVRMMIAAMMAQTGCNAQVALENIQGRIWQRIGQTRDRLNCYGLIFKPICGDLHVQGDTFCDLMPEHEHARAQIQINDYANRIHPSLFTDEGLLGLQRLIENYGYDLVTDTVISVIREPGGTEKQRYHITTWGYFVRAIKEHQRREQLRTAGLAPGDVFAHGMKMETPF